MKDGIEDYKKGFSHMSFDEVVLCLFEQDNELIALSTRNKELTEALENLTGWHIMTDPSPCTCEQTGKCALETKLREAAAHLHHLHLCEMEGIEAGQPTPDQWVEAVEALGLALQGEEHQSPPSCWAVAVLLQQREASTINNRMTLSWRSCKTKSEAVGEAVEWAQDNNPTFAILQTLAAQIVALADMYADALDERDKARAMYKDATVGPEGEAP